MSTITTPTVTALDELRTKQQQIWSSGDYNRIAAITVPVSEALVRRADPRPGQHVLDVATGTGHAALSAARRGAHVTGIDYVPGLLEVARSRAAAEDLPVDFVEAIAEDLPFDDGAFDHVVSAIGVMFAADHARAAGELVRVTRSGGRDLAGELDAHRLHRAAAQDRRRPRPTAAGRPAADPLGHRRHRARPARRRGGRLHGQPVHGAAGVRVGGGVRRLLPHLVRPHPRRGSPPRRGRAGRRCATTWSRSRPTPTAARTARSSATGSTCWSRPSDADHPHHHHQTTSTARRERCTSSIPWVGSR